MFYVTRNYGFFRTGVNLLLPPKDHGDYSLPEYNRDYKYFAVRFVWELVGYVYIFFTKYRPKGRWRIHVKYTNIRKVKRILSDLNPMILKKLWEMNQADPE